VEPHNTWWHFSDHFSMMDEGERTRITIDITITLWLRFCDQKAKGLDPS
jgi:hypothetical protein